MWSQVGEGHEWALMQAAGGSLVGAEPRLGGPLGPGAWSCWWAWSCRGGGAETMSSAETQMWICKPSAANQGKGIFLLRSQEEVAALQAKTQSVEDDPIYRKMPFRAPQARVVQRCGAWTPRKASVGSGGHLGTRWCL